MASKVRDAGKLDCWDLKHWPPNIYPHTESRAQYMVRVFRTELLNAGAISLVGRELVGALALVARPQHVRRERARAGVGARAAGADGGALPGDHRGQARAAARAAEARGVAEGRVITGLGARAVDFIAWPTSSSYGYF